MEPAKFIYLVVLLSANLGLLIFIAMKAHAIHGLLNDRIPDQ